MEKKVPKKVIFSLMALPFTPPPSSWPLREELFLRLPSPQRWILSEEAPGLEKCEVDVQPLCCTQLYQNTEITVLNKVRSLFSVHLYTAPRLYTAVPVHGDNSFKPAPRLYTAVPVHGDKSFKPAPRLYTAVPVSSTRRYSFKPAPQLYTVVHSCTSTRR